MTVLLTAIDVTLAITLVGLALGVLLSADLFRAIVLFIAFGLLMALTWARLHAVDIALAEAAIGAGLTGALFLNALAHGEARPAVSPGSRDVAGHPTVPPVSVAERPARSRVVVGGIVLPGLALGAAVVVAVALGRVPPDRADLSGSVADAIPLSGVTHPVTAVLLNFRAYDTLLEVAVLLLAVVGVWALGAPQRVLRDARSRGPVLRTLVHLLVPVIALVGGYMLWVGTKAPGGAFQAGAILAAAGVLLLVANMVAPVPLWRTPGRLAIASGFATFLAVGVGVMVRGGYFLEYPAAWAGTLIVIVEAALAVAIALMLVVLFAGRAAAVTDTFTDAPDTRRQP